MTITAHSVVPGNNGRTWSAVAALSRTSNTRLSASTDRNRAVRSSRSSGISSRRMPQRTKESEQHIGGGDRRGGGETVQVDEQLPVGEVFGDAVRKPHGESRLTHARLSAHDEQSSSRRIRQPPGQVVDQSFPSDERRGARR